jgi:hypothetical protein
LALAHHWHCHPVARAYGLTASYLLGYGAVIFAAADGTGGDIVAALTAVAVIGPLLGALFVSTGLQHGLGSHER